MRQERFIQAVQHHELQHTARKSSRRAALALGGMMAFAVAALAVVPRGLDAQWQLVSEGDPVELADRALAQKFDPGIARSEIEKALTADDADLAQSFTELAQDRGVALDPALADKVKAANDEANSMAHNAGSFARGLITGEPDDLVGLAGTALGDFFVFGDIRDAVREGTRLATGQQADQLILGLACVGLAITAGTYATLGAGTPARIGLSVVKAAKRTGRLSARMTAWIGRSLREVVDWSALGRAGGKAFSEPALAVRSAREAVKVEKAGGLVELVGRRARADQGRHPGCARWTQNVRGSARCVASGEARRGQGRQDPRHRQAARPRRHRADDRRVQPRNVDIMGGVHAVRLRVIVQKRGRAHDAASYPPAQVAAGTRSRDAVCARTRALMRHS